MLAPKIVIVADIVLTVVRGLGFVVIVFCCCCVRLLSFFLLLFVFYTVVVTGSRFRLPIQLQKLTLMRTSSAA